MGKRGPAPKPTNVRKLHGDRQDRINDAEPQPAEMEVRCPSWLSETAKRVWRRYASDLKRKGVLTAWDTEAFATFCDAAARRRRAAERLDEQGEVVDTPVYGKDGEIVGWRQVRNQWSYVWKDSNEAIQRFGARFGLTPSDRSQLTISGQEGESSDDLLSDSG